MVPLISVVIPAHNEEKDIGSCLRALKGQDCEIVVVNDGSADDTEKIARKHKVTVINFKNGHSASFARNRGAEKARGKYIVFVDADIMVPKNFIENVKKHTPFDIFSYRVLSYKPKTLFERAWSAYRKYRDSLPNKKEIHGLHGIKKSLFKKIGGYDESIFYNEDYLLKDKAIKHSKNYKVSQIAVYHKDTKSLNDFMRQRQWQGKGIYTMLKKNKNYSLLKYFLPIILLPSILVTPWIMALYFLVYWTKLFLRNKSALDTFLWVISDYFGRIVAGIELIKYFIIKK